MKLQSKISVVLILFFLVSCASKKKVVQKQLPAPKQPTVKKITPTISKPNKQKTEQSFFFLDELEKDASLNIKTLQYIRKFYPIAVSEMHKHNIPASITLAQGILESGNGYSDLATRSNNHFGIKCHKGWTGQSVYHDDDEKGECFRKYLHPDTSYEDHSEFLITRKRYDNLFYLDKTDYRSWAKGLKKAGYATDKKYPKKLIGLIERYQLYNFDTLQFNSQNIETQNLPKQQPIKESKQTPHFLYYKVKQGDTLYSIATFYNTTVAALRKENNLIDSTIYVGQNLVIKNK